MNSNISEGQSDFCRKANTYLLCDKLYVDLLLFLARYAIYAVSVIGVIGNVLTLLAAGSQATRNSASWYMCSMAVMDTVFLLLRPAFGYGHENTYVCKFLQGTLYIGDAASTWTVIAMTAERAFVVLFPFKATRFCTVGKAIAATVTVFVIACLGGAPAYLFYDTIKLCDLYLCLSNRHIGKPMYDFWSHVINSLLFYLPIPILFVLNTLIIIALTRAATAASQMTAATTNTTKSSKASKEKELTTTLFAVSVTFFLFNVPFCVMFFVGDLYDRIANACTSVVHALAMSDSVAQLLHVTGHAVNGYIYCIRSPNFRRQLSIMFKCQAPPPTSKSQTTSSGNA